MLCPALSLYFVTMLKCAPHPRTNNKPTHSSCATSQLLALYSFCLELLISSSLVAMEFDYNFRPIFSMDSLGCDNIAMLAVQDSFVLICALLLYQMTPKESFRQLSHKFHGKGPGKMKQEKRMKQYQEELKLKQMKNADTPSLSVERMREAQAQLKTPYLVLSGHVKPGYAWFSFEQVFCLVFWYLLIQFITVFWFSLMFTAKRVIQ